MRKCVAPDVKIQVKNTQGDLDSAYKSNVMVGQQQCHIEGVFGHPGENNIETEAVRDVGVSVLATSPGDQQSCGYGRAPGRREADSSLEQWET